MRGGVGREEAGSGEERRGRERWGGREQKGRGKVGREENIFSNEYTLTMDGSVTRRE